MSDFNRFNPADKKQSGVNFNTGKQGKSAQPEQPEAAAEQGTPEDPWANMKVDPSQILNLLAAQGKQNAPADIGFQAKMLHFGSQITPERHASTTKMIEKAYTQEFGKPPSATMLQEMVDDYLIGRVNIQAS